MPSCGMFVYRDVASAVTTSAQIARYGRFSVRLRKCFVSLMCDGRLLARGWMNWIMQDEKWSIGPSHPETKRWRGQFGLCIFGNPQKRDVVYSWWKHYKFHVGRVYYVLRTHVVYESASSMGCCVCWDFGEQFLCIVVFNVCVDFGEVVSCVYDANASPFITWFDYNGLVIFGYYFCVGSV